MFVELDDHIKIFTKNKYKSCLSINKCKLILTNKFTLIKYILKTDQKEDHSGHYGRVQRVYFRDQG